MLLTREQEVDSAAVYLYVVYLDKRGPVRKRVMLEVSRVKKRLGLENCCISAQ